MSRQIPQRYLWAGVLLLSLSGVLVVLALQSSISRAPGRSDHGASSSGSVNPGGGLSRWEHASPCPNPVTRTGKLKRTIRQGETKEHKLLIDWTLGASVVLFSDESDLALTLISPSGVIYDKSTAGLDSRSGYKAKSTITPTGEGWVKTLALCNPEEGEWTIRVTAVQAPSFPFSTTYLLMTPERPHGVAFLGRSPDTTVSSGNALVISALLAEEGRPVVGAEVSARVRAPNGQWIDVPLVDDGSAADARADDGMYHGELRQTQVPGSYTINYEATRFGVDGKPAMSWKTHGAAGVGRSASRLTGEIRDGTRDLDGDGHWDELVIEVAVKVTEPLEYSVSAGLTDARGQDKQLQGQLHLESGLQLLPIVVEAESFSENGRAKTPITIRWVSLAEGDRERPIQLDYLEGEYRTENYE
jgi:hypothetical protein